MSFVVLPVSLIGKRAPLDGPTDGDGNGNSTGDDANGSAGTSGVSRVLFCASVAGVHTGNSLL